MKPDFVFRPIRLRQIVSTLSFVCIPLSVRTKVRCCLSSEKGTAKVLQKVFLLFAQMFCHLERLEDLASIFLI